MRTSFHGLIRSSRDLKGPLACESVSLDRLWALLYDEGIAIGDRDNRNDQARPS